MTNDGNRFFKRILLLASAALIASSGSTGIVSYGAGTFSVPSQIRVGLFLNLGAGKFQSLTNAATLQSAGGLKLLWREPGGSYNIGNAAPGQSIRFALDGYKALVLETGDLSGAIAALKKMQASSSAAFITKVTKRGAPVYQVTEGVYSTAAAASTALEKWKNAGVAASVTALAPPKIAGPWAVEAGPYGSMAEASAAADRLGAAGLDAFVTLKLQSGGIAFGVRIGQESSAAALPALQQAAAAAGAPNVVIPEPSAKYAVVRNDMTVNGAAGSPMQLYAVPLAAGVTLRADPAADAPIQLVERSKRNYRGSMEASALNGSLAIINEVGLEPYLYSVVGAEVGSGWPAEAQKAQAVAARSYAVSSGMGFQIANVVDTTLSQAYNGTSSENANSTSGVNATAGEVVISGGKVFNAMFSSNAGGITADSKTEVWGNDVPGLASAVISPDSGAGAGQLNWYNVLLASGQTGYIREDLLVDDGQKNAAGLKLLRVKGEATTVRTKPIIDNTIAPVDKLSAGTIVVSLDKVPANGDYSWIEGPYTSEQMAALAKFVNATGPVKTVEITGVGPSGRITEVTVNGVPYKPSSPYGFRAAFGGLKSTLISVEQTGKYTVLDGNGTKRELPQAVGAVHVIDGDGNVSPSDGNLVIMDDKAQVRVVTGEPTFVIHGKGNGHGLGMSQWGARGLAEQGYDYKSILLYYYKNVTIEKDAAI
ncbi:SpoIID/LytB domain-containing protein [Cohnella faecalis]|nr:SpoIID/LytB domain-containing protein [Cohnella faecalis]